MIALEDSTLSVAAPLLLALWGVFLVIIFFGPRVSAPLV